MIISSKRTVVNVYHLVIMKLMIKNKPKKTERYTLSTTPIIMNTLREVADKNDRSLNWQIERIFKDWLIEHGHLKKETI